MRKAVYLFLAAALSVSCSNKRPDSGFNTWANASWIGLEQLQDSMLIVPGVHGSGDQIGIKVHIPA